MIKYETITFGCHKIPERCFYYKGHPMPFCSRCFGCSIGHVLAFILFITGALPPLFISIILILPLGIDWSIQKFLGIMSNNCRRLITGFLGGFGIGVIIWIFIKFCYFLILKN